MDGTKKVKGENVGKIAPPLEGIQLSSKGSVSERTVSLCRQIKREIRAKTEIKGRVG